MHGHLNHDNERPALHGEHSGDPRRGVTGYELTRHAEERMARRRVSVADLETVLRHGRVLHVRGARIFVVGRKEIRTDSALRRGAERLEGLQVVTSLEGAIMTVYRNRDFRALRDTRLHRTYERTRRRLV